jgi:hypothetical protein
VAAALAAVGAGAGGGSKRSPDERGEIRGLALLAGIESRMKWPSWFKPSNRRKPARASLTQCHKCGTEMILVERSSMSGDDMRTYRCDRCRKEHIIDFGTALWKKISDAPRSDE